MKQLLKSPVVNAVCISIFTAFYALIFFKSLNDTGFENNFYYNATDFIWPAWYVFYANGRQRYIAYVLIAVTALVVALLMVRRRPYDEYHTTILINCIVVAAVLTLAAIAIFYLMVLDDPEGIITKFTLFIVIHWTTVVFADLVYVLLCRWR